MNTIYDDHHHDDREEVDSVMDQAKPITKTEKYNDEDDFQHEQVELDTGRLLDPSYIGRKQMEMRAQHLIQQVELIETTTRQGRNTTTSFLQTFENTNHNMDMWQLPPKLLALSTNTSMTSSSTIAGSDALSGSTSSPVDTTNEWRNNSLRSSSMSSDSSFKYDDVNHHDHGTGMVHSSHSSRFEAPLVYHQDSALADDLSSTDDTTTSRNGVATSSTEMINETAMDDAFYKNRIDELERENARLRQMVSTCCRAAVNVQTNHDLKLLQLQLELVNMKQQLHNEMGINSKISVSNASLRKQLNMAASEVVQNKHENKMLFCNFVSLHQRELVTEKHLNSLILSRNQTMNELTELKKLVLTSCCTSCRQCIVPQLHRLRKENSSSGTGKTAQRSSTYSTSASSSLTKSDNSQQLPSDDGTVATLPVSATVSQPLSPRSSSSKSRTYRNLPTYQSSARQLVLDQQQQLLHLSSSSINSMNSSSSSARKLKSCLKKTETTGSVLDSPTGTMNSNKQSSPTSVATIIINSLPESLIMDTEQHKKGEAVKDVDKQYATSNSMNSIVSGMSDSGFGDTPELHHNPQHHDAWSNTSDMSVSTMPPLPNRSTITSSTTTTTSSMQQSPVSSRSTTNIPDATTQRKLDLQRHHALLQTTKSSSSKSFVGSMDSRRASNQPQPQQQQPRHRFFGLRKKKDTP